MDDVKYVGRFMPMVNHVTCSTKQGGWELDSEWRAQAEAEAVRLMGTKPGSLMQVSVTTLRDLEIPGCRTDNGKCFRSCAAGPNVARSIQSPLNTSSPVRKQKGSKVSNDYS